jgi:ribonuclease HI
MEEGNMIPMDSKSPRLILHFGYEPPHVQGYFDGDSQGNPRPSGVAGWIILPNCLKLCFKHGIGREMNNQAKLLAISTLLDLVGEVGI